MANKYSGTQTEKNLIAAFAGESQARNKYTYFASKAKKEGYEQIAALFLKTADNEKERDHHCDSGFLKLLYVLKDKWMAVHRLVHGRHYHNRNLLHCESQRRLLPRWTFRHLSDDSSVLDVIRPVKLCPSVHGQQCCKCHYKCSQISQSHHGFLFSCF